MKSNRPFWVIAGLLNVFTGLLHTIAGQMDLVNPLLKSNLQDQEKSEWIGAWHMVTILLFATSYYLLKYGFAKNRSTNIDLVKFIGVLYILFSIPFIISSVLMQVFAPQWMLLLPIGVLTIIGCKRK